MSRASFFLLCTLIAATPLMRGSVHLWATSLIQIATLFILALLIIESIKNNTPLFKKSPLTLPILALLALTGISAAVSDYSYLAIEGYLMLLTYIAIYYITLTVVSTRKHKRILIYTIIATALFLALFGLFKRFGMNPFPWWEYAELHYPPDMIDDGEILVYVRERLNDKI